MSENYLKEMLVTLADAGVEFVSAVESPRSRFDDFRDWPMIQISLAELEKKFGRKI